MSYVARILTQLLKLKPKFFQIQMPSSKSLSLKPHCNLRSTLRQWREIKTSNSFGSWKTIKNEMNSKLVSVLLTIKVRLFLM